VAVAFSVWTEFTVRTGERQWRGSGHPRGMALATHMQELQAEEQRREAQWHPRECKPLFEKLALHSSRNPMLTLTQQNPWLKSERRTLPFTASALVAKGSWLLEREEYVPFPSQPVRRHEGGSLAHGRCTFSPFSSVRQNAWLGGAVSLGHGQCTCDVIGEHVTSSANMWRHR
jgi:hypothetical protein